MTVIIINYGDEVKLYFERRCYLVETTHYLSSVQNHFHLEESYE